MLIEGTLLGFASAVLGTVLGVVFTYPLATSGLDFSQEMGETMMVEGVAMDALMLLSTRLSAWCCMPGSRWR